MKFLSKLLYKDNKKNNKKHGFTLVEILIVVAVIGILFVTLVPRIDFAGDKARETGIKTDFRSFELAAEQILRENGGIKDIDELTTLCADGKGINLYLDDALKFDTSGDCAKEDQWNQAYTIQVKEETAAAGATANPNNGTIIFISNGKDSFKDKDADNYVLAVTFVDGQISSATSGFSTNIESDAIASITAGSTLKMEVDADKVSNVTYDKD